jgi:transposase-like protein
MSSKRGKSYAREFKLEAVKLAEKIGITKASAELDVTSKSLRAWMNGDSLGKATSKSKTQSYSELEAELKIVRKENKRLKTINDVLKKSTAIFSGSHIGD